MFGLFAILQKYDFSSKSQLVLLNNGVTKRCLRYCKSTIFQANHNKVLFERNLFHVVCDTAKVRFFKQITTDMGVVWNGHVLFAILQKYDFSSKSQHIYQIENRNKSCLRYCKSTIFQANHNGVAFSCKDKVVVCDTAKVRFFKQITTGFQPHPFGLTLFAILQKYDFSSKSQQVFKCWIGGACCLRYCKSTIFQANHNYITRMNWKKMLFAILQKYDFSSKSQQYCIWKGRYSVVCDTAKVRFFKQITTCPSCFPAGHTLFAILQKYDFSSKSQPRHYKKRTILSCLRYCKSTIFQANHN